MQRKIADEKLVKSVVFSPEAQKFTFEAQKHLKGWLLTVFPFQAKIIVPEAEKHAFSTQKRPKIPFFML